MTLMLTTAWEDCSYPSSRVYQSLRLESADGLPRLFEQDDAETPQHRLERRAEWLHRFRQIADRKTQDIYDVSKSWHDDDSVSYSKETFK